MKIYRNFILYTLSDKSSQIFSSLTPPNIDHNFFCLPCTFKQKFSKFYFACVFPRKFTKKFMLLVSLYENLQISHSSNAFGQNTINFLSSMCHRKNLQIIHFLLAFQWKPTKISNLVPLNYNSQNFHWMYRSQQKSIFNPLLVICVKPANSLCP